MPAKPEQQPDTDPHGKESEVEKRPVRTGLYWASSDRIGVSKLDRLEVRHCQHQIRNAVDENSSRGTTAFGARFNCLIDASPNLAIMHPFCIPMTANVECHANIVAPDRSLGSPVAETIIVEEPSRFMQPQSRICRQLLCTIALAMCVAGAQAQQDNPVYVDDSPRAWELLRRARAQLTDNKGQAIRLYQELMDDYGMKLVPFRDSDGDHFVAVRSQVLKDLRSSRELLQRYRAVQHAEAQRLIEAGEFVQLAMTRSLTGPGLDAMLRLAQESLESARFHAAIAWLDQAARHPDLDGESAGHCWFMYAQAGHYLQRNDYVQSARSGLALLGDAGEEFLDRLAPILTDARPPPSSFASVSVLDRTKNENLTELVAQTIWSSPLNDSLLNRRAGGSRRLTAPRGGFERRRNRGDLTTAAAAVTDTTVYVNEGHTVHALDRFSGRSAWSQPYSDRLGLEILDPDSQAIGDMNLITVQGEYLVTLTGHAYETKRSSDGKLICLDARTGELRWAGDLDRIDDTEDHEGLFPHGEPIIDQGTVYVLARRTPRQMLIGCYVVALDLQTGEPKWIRHVASSGGRTTARPFSTGTRPWAFITMPRSLSLIPLFFTGMPSPMTWHSSSSRWKS